MHMHAATPCLEQRQQLGSPAGLSQLDIEFKALPRIVERSPCYWRAPSADEREPPRLLLTRVLHGAIGPVGTERGVHPRSLRARGLGTCGLLLCSLRAFGRLGKSAASGMRKSQRVASLQRCASSGARCSATLPHPLTSAKFDASNLHPTALHDIIVIDPNDTCSPCTFTALAQSRRLAQRAFLQRSWPASAVLLLSPLVSPSSGQWPAAGMVICTRARTARCRASTG